MALSSQQKIEIKNVIVHALRKRFKDYRPESSFMPFHTRLLGGDRMALYSFIHSLCTNFGTSIFESVALSLAKNYFKVAKSHVPAGEFISEGSLFEIQRIIDSLTAGDSKPDKIKEIETIKRVCRQGIMRKVKPTKIDVSLEDKNGKLFLFDLKTAKPNKGGFRECKRTLLEWAAIVLAENPKKEVNTFIAVPYNPYEPKPYARWTIAGMLDLKEELKVAKEFWDFLGGKDCYEYLLDCFEKVGIELRDEIDDYFRQYQRQK